MLYSYDPSCVSPFHTRSALQNFLALCASNYYDGCIFHRNIKTFMIQTGDPTGMGKGGQSIWAKPFEDEIRSTIKVRNGAHQPFPPLGDPTAVPPLSLSRQRSRWI